LEEDLFRELAEDDACEVAEADEKKQVSSELDEPEQFNFIRSAKDFEWLELLLLLQLSGSGVRPRRNR